MNTWVRKSFKVGVLSAGVLLFAGNAANAANLNSFGNSGLLSGNQINLQAQAPIDVCGNAIGVVGNASAGCEGGSWATLGGDAGPDMNSFGNSGVLSGNQINAQIQAPIDVCGNAVGVFGNTQAGCKGGSWATLGGGDDANEHSSHHYNKTWNHKNKATGTHTMKAKPIMAHGTEGHTLEGTNLNSFGNSGIGSGNQVNLGLQVPVDVCGNAIGIVGNAQASCEGGATATGGTGDVSANSGFNSGILSGNQVNGLVQIPVNVCGNAIGLFGNVQAGCKGGSTATAGGGDESNGGSWGGDKGGDKGGNTGGNTGGYYASAPGHTTGSAWGEGKTAKGVAKGGYKHEHDMSGMCQTVLNSFGNSGLVSGNQINVQAQAPIEISGNAVGALGNSQASSMGGAWANC